MPAAPPPDYVYIEPRSAFPAPRKFAIHWAVENIAAGAPGTVYMYLGDLAPWNLYPIWVEVRQLKIAMMHNVLAGTLLVYPDFTFGQTIVATGVSGYQALEPKTITGRNNPDAVNWPDVNLVMTGEAFTGPIGQKSPLLYIRFEDNNAADDAWIYLDGTFYERFDATEIPPADVKKFLGWGR